jgi:hypothetical protein
MKGIFMARLSSKKLNELKEVNLLTNEEISKLTGIPLFAVEKLFSGRNLYPTMWMLVALMELFSCDMKDLFEYEEDEFGNYECFSNNCVIGIIANML